jgi:hypothetical protein
MIDSNLNLNHQTVRDILTEELGMWTFGCCVTTTFPVPYVKEDLNKNSFALIKTPPYSHDLIPRDFLLFPNLKFHLKVSHFVTEDNMQNVVTDQLRARPHEDFQHCYLEWKHLLQRCVDSQGNYFEEHVINI